MRNKKLNHNSASGSSASSSTRRLRGGQHAQKGFTIAEVLLSIIVFTISVVGIVSMQRASIASENSAGVLRAGQRLGTNQMEELQSRSFNDLVEFDFLGSPDPAYPFDDLQLVRLFPYRGAPMDIDWGTAGPAAGLPPGMRQNHYRVVRRISALPEGVSPGVAIDVQAVQLQVWVLWLDYQPSTPAPEVLTVGQLTPDMLDSTSSNFRPYVQGIHLTTVRANDGAASELPQP
jgi:type II secretory pathway pseudopilin PulG